MPNFNIVKKTTPEKTFRVKSVQDKFELQTDSIEESFKGSIDIDTDWQIGLIVGASGTGKTTIVQELFKDCIIQDFNFNSDAVINDMPKKNSTTDIYKMFNSVGFSSPPSWIKPYNVLSNGEKMRVELAYSLLCDEKDIVVFDEFTSVVDRQVAKVGSFATQKAIRKTEKKFIAVGCHYDVEEWLMPDWVFDTNTMCLKYNTRRLQRRPEIKTEIYEIKREYKKNVWEMFKRYHYLSHSMNSACQMFALVIDDNIVGMSANLHFPHPKVKNIKKEHRLVVHPDYQGLNLGVLLSSFVGEYYKEKGFRYSSVTTNPSLMYARKKDNRWKLTRKGRVSSGSGSVHNKNVKNSTSKNRITTTWEYCG